MAHFAKLDTDNTTVIAVTPVADANAATEADGIAYLTKIHGYPNWKQYSYNTRGNTHILGGTPFRGNIAIIGGTYDAENDVFIGPKPYPSWVLNTSTWLWEAPVAEPDPDTYDSGNPKASQGWNEETQSWDLTADE
jgi:hypothetical protein